MAEKKPAAVAEHAEGRNLSGVSDIQLNQSADTRTHPNAPREPPTNLYKTSAAQASLSEVQLPSTNDHTRSNGDGYGSLTGQISFSNDSTRAASYRRPRIPSIRTKPSAAARLRVVSGNLHPSPTDMRSRQEEESPRSASKGSVESSPWPLTSAVTFPLQPRNDSVGRQGPSVALRDRGRSTSSSRAGMPILSIPLRSSASIPDWSTSEVRYSRQRNPNNNSQYRADRGFTDPTVASSRRDQGYKPTSFEAEEVRTSVRSALTTTSSFVGTSGTERSSVLTKSSATSLMVYDEGIDEGMSVDDAIGMYENGFADSGAEDDYPSRPGSSQSHQSSVVKLADLQNQIDPASDFLDLPPSLGVITRDSHSIFRVAAASGGDMSAFQPSQAVANEEHKVPGRTRDDTQSAPPLRFNWNQQSPYGADRDIYGFRKKSQHISVEQHEFWSGPYRDYLARRRKKWVALLKDAGLPTENPVRFPPKSSKVKRFVRKGIPPDWRGAAWFYYAGGPAMVARHSGLYEELVRNASNGELSPTDAEIIERDLNRTFPDNVMFKPDPIANVENADGDGSDAETLVQPETPILQSLRRVLQAFAIHNPRIGYCQSLNFLAGMLLFFMDEEKAFWMLNIITREYLPGTHEVNLEGANVDLGVLMTSVRESMPTIWAKIGGELDGSISAPSNLNHSMRLPPITLCLSAWFMSCFIGTLPVETTLRVWDSFFYEGSKTLFRISLAIFKVGEQEIKAVNDPMEIFQVVQTIPRRIIDCNALLEACFKRRNGFGHLSQETIERRRAERRKGYADERARIAAGITIPPDGVIERKRTIFGRSKSKSRPKTSERSLNRNRGLGRLG
jgi:hypothetical protein